MKKQTIEEKFEQMKLQHQLFSKTYTSIEDVLQLMYENPEKVWWWSWEFNGKNNKKGGFLSHRACARASDLALHWPNLVEDRRIGRFKVYRMRSENMDRIKSFLGLNKK